MRPPPASPGEGIVLHKLVEEVNSGHVLGVISNDFGPLDSDLFVPHSSVATGLPPLDVVLGDGLMAGGDHGDNSDPLPYDDEEVTFPPPHHLTTRKEPGILADSFEDSGGSTDQPKGTTHVNTGIVEFLSKGHGVVVIIHEQVVSLLTEPIHEAEDGIMEGRKHPRVHREVDHVTCGCLSQEEVFGLRSDLFIFRY